MTRAQIIGTGSYAPEKIMTNHDLAKIVETWVEMEVVVARAGNLTAIDLAPVRALVVYAFVNRMELVC